MRYLFLILFFFISFDGYSQVSRNFNKKKKPLYELGAGFVGLSTPNYPGAASNTPRYIPAPLFIYRGDLFRSDEDGTRARLINSDIVELGASAGFNFPIDSNSNASREGMPDTDTLFGIGPGLLVKLLKGDPLNKLTVGVGLRINLAIGKQFFIAEQGWVIEPRIRYWRKLNRNSDIRLFSSLSLSYGDKKYNQFFYQVDPKFETEDRKAYDAVEGIVNIRGSVGGSYDFSEKATIFLGIFESNLTAAANKESPLVQEQTNTGYIIGFVWLFYESDKLVE